ncbi:MAG: hypothetical protein R3B09_21790 [Nannocystaceae bacterium]
MVSSPSLARVVAVSAAMATACGYTSSYVPPDGWRARPLYHGNEVIMVGPTELPRCIVEGEAPEGATEGPPPPRMAIDDNGYWGPRVGFIVIGRPLPPPHWVFLSHGYVPLPPGPHNLFLGSWGGALFKGSGGGGGKGAGMVAAFFAAIAVAASSGIAIGLAADPPEDSEDTARGIDAVNAYNDRARTIMSECLKTIERDGPPVVEVEIEVAP